MGLDMYAGTTSAEFLNDNIQVSDDLQEFYINGEEQKINKTENNYLFYWRGFYQLECWMEALFERKYAQQEKKFPDIDVFNCVYLRITEDDLNQLRDDTCLKHMDSIFGEHKELSVAMQEANPIIQNQGNPVFFIKEKLYKSHMEALKKFIKQARAEINNGSAVFYHSWW